MFTINGRTNLREYILTKLMDERKDEQYTLDILHMPVIYIVFSDMKYGKPLSKEALVSIFNSIGMLIMGKFSRQFV